MLNKSIQIIPLFLLLSFRVGAQSSVEMADIMRTNGKIYVVVAIILIILSGLFVVLYRLDRKLDRLENEVSEKNNKV